jgi:hypothetical protein
LIFTYDPTMRRGGLFVGVSVGICACGESGFVPDLVLPSSINVVEANWTSYVAEPGYTLDAEVRVTFDLGRHSDRLQVSPQTFTLSPTIRSQEIRFIGLGDANSDDESVEIYVSSEGGSASIEVALLDQQVQRAIPSFWNFTMEPDSTAFLDVHLTQPPDAPATVRVMSNDTFEVYGKPFELVFDGTNFDLPQTITLTSRPELARGPVEVFLFSDFAMSTIVISPPEWGLR